MSGCTWASIAAYTSKISAEVAVARLLVGDVPAYIATNDFIPGFGSDFSVLVPVHLRKCASTILEQARLAGAELNLVQAKFRMGW